MNVFTPQTNATSDTIAHVLGTSIRVLLVIAIGCLPILLLPVATVGIVTGKLYLTAVLLLSIVVLLLLHTLRVGTISLPFSATLAAAWVFAGVTGVGAALSGDVADSFTFIGGTFTASHVLLMVLALSTVTVAVQSVHAGVWVLRILFVTTATLLVWYVLQAVTTFDMSFGVLANNSASWFGGWTDLPYLAAALVVGVLLAVAHGVFRGWLHLLGGASVVAAIGVLWLVNSVVVWMFLAVIALVVVVSTIMRRNNKTTPSLLQSANRPQVPLLGYALVVLLASLFPIIGGASFQQLVTNVTNTPLVEVRPSLVSSLAITRAVWDEQPILGVGANQYDHAWRLHKNPALNDTAFWNTDFTTGHNHVLTQAVTGGVAGVTVWIVLMSLFIVSGARTFLSTPAPVKDTRFIVGVIAYCVALVGIAAHVVSNPSVPFAVITFAVMGMYLGVSFVMRPRSQVQVSLLNNQRLSFVLVAVAVIVMIFVVWVLQTITEQLVAQSTANRALTADDTTYESAVAGLTEAYQIRPGDDIARTMAALHTQRMQQLIAVPEPTNVEQQQFQQATVAAVNAVAAALASDDTEPANWYQQAQVYGLLAQVEIEGAYDRAMAAVERVAALDPHNPRSHLLRAELAQINGDTTAAREAAISAVQQKPNYSAALSFLASLEIAANNTDAAIAATAAILQYDPNNPARWYQLGVLQQAAGDQAAAIAALSEAVALDGEYANALYVRGVLYANAGDTEAALADLYRVRDLNPDNESVRAQITAIESGNLPAADAGSAPAEPIAEDETTDADELSEAAAETDLITTTTANPSSEEETDEVE